MIKILTILFVLFLSACTATDGPSRNSMLDGKPIIDKDEHLFNIYIVDVDGRSKNSFKSHITPGFHSLRLRSNKASETRVDSPDGFTHAKSRSKKSNYFDGLQTHSLMAKACTRYILQAYHQDLLDDDSWSLKVYSKPMKGCTAKESNTSSG